MPIYEYECAKCGKKMSEFFHTAAAARVPKCAKCGSKDVRRILSRVSVVSSDEDAGFDDLGDAGEGGEEGGGGEAGDGEEGFGGGEESDDGGSEPDLGGDGEDEL